VQAVCIVVFQGSDEVEYGFVLSQGFVNGCVVVVRLSGNECSLD